jgi:integrase
MEILEKAKAFRNESGLIFSGRKNQPLSDMSLTAIIRRINGVREDKGLAQWVDPNNDRPIVPHGFRSTFRDWGAETTTYPHEMQEIALAHSVGTKVELAYRRGDMFEKRRAMLDDWGRYCTGTNANIHSINEKTRSVA